MFLFDLLVDGIGDRAATRLRKYIALLKLVFRQPGEVILPREGRLAPLLALRALPAGRDGSHCHSYLHSTRVHGDLDTP